MKIKDLKKAEREYERLSEEIEEASRVIIETIRLLNPEYRRRVIEVRAGMDRLPDKFHDLFSVLLDELKKERENLVKIRDNLEV